MPFVIRTTVAATHNPRCQVQSLVENWAKCSLLSAWPSVLMDHPKGLRTGEPAHSGRSRLPSSGHHHLPSSTLPSGSTPCGADHGHGRHAGRSPPLVWSPLASKLAKRSVTSTRRLRRAQFAAEFAVSAESGTPQDSVDCLSWMRDGKSPRVGTDPSSPTFAVRGVVLSLPEFPSRYCSLGTPDDILRHRA